MRFCETPVASGIPCGILEGKYERNGHRQGPVYVTSVCGAQLWTSNMPFSSTLPEAAVQTPCDKCLPLQILLRAVHESKSCFLGLSVYPEAQSIMLPKTNTVAAFSEAK